MTPESILEELIRAYKVIGIPVPDRKIARKIIYSRSTTKLGSCKLDKKTGEYQISLSVYALKDPEEIRKTLAHELIHTLPGCMNHQAAFHRYAAIVEHSLGIPVETRATRDSQQRSGIAKARMAKVKYMIRCTQCDYAYYRMKRSALVLHPERYRCGKCGGKLEVYVRHG